MSSNVYRDPSNNLKIFSTTFEDLLTGDRFHEYIIEKIAREIAEKYVEDNYAQIVARLDQQAIANLSIAEASKKIAEEIQRRPVVQDINVKTQVHKHFSLF